MFRFHASTKKRVDTLRLKRHDQRERLLDFVIGKSAVDDDNDDDEDDKNDDGCNESYQSDLINVSTEPLSTSDVANPIHYDDDEFDDIHPLHENYDNEDDFVPLFDGSATSVCEAVRKLTSFFVDFNVNKKAAIKLLRIIKDLLPAQNRLPTTWKSIMKVLGHVSSSTKNFLCSQCYQKCRKDKYGKFKCQNYQCSRFDQMIKSNQLVELIHMDIRSQIQSILNRNKSLFNHSDLHPKSDICFGDHYRNLGDSAFNRITLILHTDGAPLVKLSKQSLWPCFGSIVELPPPVREYQQNIIVLALWSSTIKPDPNIFLYESIEELKHLLDNGTSIFIDGLEFEINVKTQYFISDLPAKSLFCQTIHFNGYSACTECLSTGMSSETYFSSF